MKQDIKIALDVPSGVTVSYENGVFKATGGAGEVQKIIHHPKIAVTIEGAVVTLATKQEGTRREKMHIKTMESHVTNVMQGANEGFVYELKVCSGHFPMTASVKGEQFELKNFLGESYPRKLTLKKGAKVTVNGDQITVEAADKELAGQVAADLEQLTRITNRDRRIFQDGIFITKKAGKDLVM